MALTLRTSQNKHSSTRLTCRSTILGLVVAVGMSMTTQAHAFLKESSSQRVIRIGSGDAQHMQAVQVNTIPVNNYQAQQSHQGYTPYDQYQYQYQYQNQAQIPEYQPVQPIYSEGYVDNQVYNVPSSSVYQQNHHAHQQSNSQSPSQYPQYSNNAQYQNQPPAQYPSYQHHAYQPSYSQYTGTESLALGDINSAAVLVYDMQTGQPIFQKNADISRSIASITKVMTAMVAIDSGQDMKEELMISANDLRGAKNASTRLKAGDRLSRSEFMLMMLMKSENPAAKTLANHYFGGYQGFIDAMNQKAQSLGMYSTRFSDSSGLDPRNKSSARDLAKMMREVATNPRYQTIRNFSTAPSYDFYINNYNSGSRVYSAANTSSLVRAGGQPILASKTGFIREAGYCVVMETNVNGRPAIVVLLGAKNSQNRWRDAGNILSTLAMR